MIVGRSAVGIRSSREGKPVLLLSAINVLGGSGILGKAMMLIEEVVLNSRLALGAHIYPPASGCFCCVSSSCSLDWNSKLVTE